MQSLCLAMNAPQGRPLKNTLQGATLTLDFTTGTATQNGQVVATDDLLTCDRASPGAVMKSGQFQEFAADTLRRTSRGLLVEEQRTNFVLNSNIPTNQTLSLSAGTYILWIAGEGSVAVSGAGTGVATAGIPLTFTLASTGDVSLGLTGTVQFMQLEQGLFPTSPISTSAAPVTRLTDKIRFVDASWLDPQNCLILVEWEQAVPGVGVQNLLRWNNASYSRLRSGSAVLAQINNAEGALVSNAGIYEEPPTGVHRIAVSLAPDNMSVAWSASLTGSAGIATDTIGTPAGGASAIYLGSNDGIEILNGWVRNIYYWPEYYDGISLVSLLDS